MLGPSILNTWPDLVLLVLAVCPAMVHNAAGYEVASAARAARDRKTPPVSIGSRDKGSNGVLDDLNSRRRHSRKLQLFHAW